jgi:BON domain
MRKLCLFIATFIVASQLVWGATTPAKPAAKNVAGASRISDADLEKAINAKFAASKISTDKFKAHVQGGVATLEGFTEVVQHKGTATRLAKTAGALAVVNNIEISQAAKDKAQANLDSGRRRAQVKRSDTSAPRTQQ